MTTDLVAAGRSLALWLVDEGRWLDPAVLMEGLGYRMMSVGLPIHRLTVSLRVLSPTVLAVGATWKPGEPTEIATYDYAERDTGMYERSPYKVVHETGKPLTIALDETPDDRFGIVPELKAAGYRHYCVHPLRFSDGVVNALTISTRDEAGFPPDFDAFLAEMLPAFTNVMEVFTYHRVLKGLLTAYVGAGPAGQIISGTTHRGEVTRMHAAVLFVDLRGFTALSVTMPPEDTADLLNSYYDLVVPAMTDKGGDILKFIGDGVLAIFADGDEGPGAACVRALSAAEAALAAAVAHVAGEGPPIHFGVALHHGEVAYGNVGSGERLDFTVVGRDVNIAARISALCSSLGRPLLVSAGFKDLVEERTFSTCGWHDVRGLSDPIEVFEPAPQ